MAFGLSTSNNSNELTLSSDGLLFGYIGRATFQSLVANETTTADAFSGYSIYTITWPTDIVVAIGLDVGAGRVAFRSQTQSGSTWTITVYRTGNTLDGLGFYDQAAANVYVWGLPTTVSGFGMAIYNAAGVLTGDLTRRPLVAAARIAMPSTVTSIPMPAVSVPAMIGDAGRSQNQSVRPGASFWINRRRHGAWQWDTSPVPPQLVRTTFQREYSQEDGGIPVTNVVIDTNALLIEAAGL